MKNLLKFILFIAVIGLLVWFFSGNRSRNVGDITIINDFDSEEVVIDNDDSGYVGPDISEEADDEFPSDAEGEDLGNEDLDSGPVGLDFDNSDGGVKATTFRYTEDGFDFDSHPVKVGNSLFFTNITDSPLYLASDDHPTHENYPALNVGPILKGEIVEVLFIELGEFGFHNHNNPSHGGVVNVVEEF